MQRDGRPSELEAPTKQCKGCRRTLPLKVFAVLGREGKHRHTYCNSCRAARFEVHPATQRKRRYVERAKAKPCVDCNQVFDTACMHLVHTYGAQKFNVTSAWRWHSEDDVTDELTKCVPVCANCKRVRNKARQQYRDDLRRLLAVDQRAAMAVRAQLDSA